MVNAVTSLATIILSSSSFFFQEINTFTWLYNDFFSITFQTVNFDQATTVKIDRLK